MDLPAISPMPPVATGVGMPWDVPVTDPVATLGAARAALGDTFVVDSGPDRYLFTFSPTGVAAFYALPEEQASKGMADFRMLRRKVPGELFAGRRTLPFELFGRHDVASYLVNLQRALDAAVLELGDAGELDVFAFTRRLGHRLGLASWGGPGAADGQRFEQLIEALDGLDGSESFVHPDAMEAVAASGMAAERAALETATALLGLGVDELPGAEADHPLFARIVARWAGEPDDVRRIGAAHDVVLVHIASMSNLFAALGWGLVDLLDHPAELAAVAAGDDGLAERCALESTRLAQRSIMARYVMAPVTLDVGTEALEVPAGVTIATLLPLTNTTAASGLEAWQPERWHRRRLAAPSQLPAVELVTAFGHGRHTCPAQPFSLAAMSASLVRLTADFELTPSWDQHPRPVRGQIGGVARAEGPCLVRFRHPA